MTTDLTRPEIPLQVITPDDVHASIARARRGLERAAEEIVWQIEMEAWRTLAYSSWGAMREAEYGGAAFMVPSKSRPEIVARIRAAGITQREIAATAGVGVGTVNRDLAAASVPNGTDGRTDVRSLSPENSAPGNNEMRRTAQNAEPDDDVIVVEQGGPIEFDPRTGEVLDGQQATDPAPAGSVGAAPCPTCSGTGKVTR